MKKHIIISLLFVISLSVFAKNNNQKEWKKVSIPEICSLEVPLSMEIRDKNSIINTIMKDYVESYNLKLSENQVILQPKGFEKMEYFATSLYARILISFERGDYSEIKNMVANITVSDLKDITELFQGQVKEAMEIGGMTLLKISSTSIKNIGNRKALYFEYIRKSTDSNKSDVLVHSYRVFDNKYYTEITFSHRIGESEIWKKDFERCKMSFVFQ